jgi:aspartate-semialdehyde dehydrogenase
MSSLSAAGDSAAVSTPRQGRTCVAVVGATGAAGSTVLRILEERGFPCDDLRLLASERSAGTRVTVAGRPVEIHAVDEAALEGVDVAFFAAGSSVARRFAPVVAARGGVAIDKSSAFRMDPDVPLVVPEVNGATVTAENGILSNPNCVAIPLSIILAPLHRQFGLAHVTVATYQAASGGGRGLAAELEDQTRAAAQGDVLEHRVYPHVLHGNVVPGGWTMFGDDTEEEIKITEEARRVIGFPGLPLSVTTVRVPVAVGHSAAVWIQMERPVSPGEVRAVLEHAPGVRVVDESGEQVYPTPRDAAGQDDVLVGRIRGDSGRPGGTALFFSADNLRKGAATNAVQVAELALSARRR